jgi:drug/metabolite transporter (DMT)-like permease
MRVVVQQLAIFLLPILLYAAYLWWRRWRARAAGEPEPPWEQGNWFWVVVVALVLTIASFFVMDALTQGSFNISPPGRP